MGRRTLKVVSTTPCFSRTWSLMVLQKQRIQPPKPLRQEAPQKTRARWRCSARSPLWNWVDPRLNHGRSSRVWPWGMQRKRRCRERLPNTQHEAKREKNPGKWGAKTSGSRRKKIKFGCYNSCAQVCNMFKTIRLSSFCSAVYCLVFSFFLLPDRRWTCKACLFLCCYFPRLINKMGPGGFKAPFSLKRKIQLITWPSWWETLALQSVYKS